MNDRDVPHAPQKPLGRSDGDRWVVGVDGSEPSRHAARWAAAQVSERASEFQLAASWNVPASAGTIPMSTLTTSASFDALEESAQAAVDDVACKLGTSVEVPITRSVGQGGAAACLLEAAGHSALLVAPPPCNATDGRRPASTRRLRRSHPGTVRTGRLSR